jgi:anti-sigma B factor antagonist
MEIRSRALGSAAVVELSGRLTVNDQPGQLKAAVARALEGGSRHVLLDLSRVRYIDSTRLGEIIAAHVTVSRQGGQLKLVATPDRIVELLTMAGLADVFERFPTVDEARKGIES